MAIHVYADFNNMDELGRVRLNTFGTRRDIEELKVELMVGLPLVLYMEDIEVDAVLEFDGGWVGVPDWSNYRTIEAEADSN